MTLSTILIWVVFLFIVYLFYLAMKGTKPVGCSVWVQMNKYAPHKTDTTFD